MKRTMMILTMALLAGTMFAGEKTLKPGDSITDTMNQAKPGDTVTLTPGVYRQAVVSKAKGTAQKPITLKGPAKGIAIISGADQLTGWTSVKTWLLRVRLSAPFPAPQPDKLFMLKLDWTPKRLFAGVEDGEAPATKMHIARTPNEGWWGVKKGLTLSEFIVADDAKIPANIDETWTVALLEQAGGSVMHISVKAWDPETRKITLAKPYSTYREKIDTGDKQRDRFFLENHLSTLDGPGQYVIQPDAEGKGCTLYIWPAQVDEKGQPLVFAPKRETVDIRNIAHVTFDGLEIAYSNSHGFDAKSEGAAPGMVITNCFIHDAMWYGVGLRGPKDVHIIGNAIWGNNLGVNVQRSSGTTIVKHNDIGWNWVDGLVGPSSQNLTIQGNYIHDHYLWGHPDNIQFWQIKDGPTVSGLKVLDNILLHAGQGIMSHGMEGAIFRNNIFAGTNAVAFIIGGKNTRVEHNTIAATAAPTNYSSAENLTSTANIYAALNPTLPLTWKPGWAFDYDLIWACKGYKKALVVKGRWKAYASSLAQIQEKFEIEQNGRVAAPKFISAPAYYSHIPYNKPQVCTRSKLYMKKPSLFKVGDVVEVNFDTIPRQVTVVDGNFITINPPLKKEPTTSYQVANWKQTDAKKLFWDLRPSQASPAKGAGPNNKDIGSNLSIPAYIKGDFNGDGKIDRPATPNMVRWLKGNGFETRIPQ